MRFTLTEKPNQGAIEYKGETLFLDCSFNNVLEVLQLMEAKDYSMMLKIQLAFIGLVTNSEDFEDRFDLIEQSEIVTRIFTEVLNEKRPEKIVYDRRGEPMPIAKKEDEGSTEESFSFEHDASYIFTSFMQAYGIDLHEEIGVMPWYKFRLLLRDLPQETKFKEVIRIREWDGKGASAKEKAKMREAQEFYALPEKR